MFFVVEPGAGGKDSPCKYYDAVPMTILHTMRYGCRLDQLDADLSCTDLYQWYVHAKEQGLLPPPNIASNEYWTR